MALSRLYSQYRRHELRSEEQNPSTGNLFMTAVRMVRYDLLFDKVVNGLLPMLLQPLYISLTANRIGIKILERKK